MTKPKLSPLEELQAARAKLLKSMGSPVAEIEQPLLGRTQYRSAAELQRSLNAIDAEISRLTGSSGASVTIIRSIRTKAGRC